MESQRSEYFTLLDQAKVLASGGHLYLSTKRRIESSSHFTSCLHEPVRELFSKEIIILAPHTGVRDAFAQLDKNKIDVALVCEAPGTFLGTVSIDSLAKVILSDNRHDARQHPQIVSTLMARNVLIEPDDATLLEVIERISLSDSQCVVIVDERGNPVRVLHEKLILNEFYSQQFLEGK